MTYDEIESLTNKQINELYADVIEANGYIISDWYCYGYCRCTNGNTSGRTMQGYVTNSPGDYTGDRYTNSGQQLCDGLRASWQGYHPCYELADTYWAKCTQN